MLTDWLTDPQIWIIAGIALIIIELFIGGMIALPVGISALGMAGFVYADGIHFFSASQLVTTWEGILILFAVLTIVCVGLLKFLFRGNGTDDINKY